MLNCVETQNIFFDSMDHLVAEDSTVMGSEFWRHELKSVKERRADFLHEMGFNEHDCFSGVDDLGSFEMGSERMVERSGAVSISGSSGCVEECDVLFNGRECDENTYLVVDYDYEHSIGQSTNAYKDAVEPSTSKVHKEECKIVDSINKKIGHWWKELMNKSGKTMSKCKIEPKDTGMKKFDWSRTKVQVSKKRLKELSALFGVQEIQAHKGIIWSMKFSPNGQYLASGGQDGVVKVWRVKSIDSCHEKFSDEFSHERIGFAKENKKVKVQVVVPDEMFQLEDQPIHEFYGHSGEVLDLAWSNANCLISSSTDKTVRLWQVGCDHCLNIYHHTDYVTCVQFNPVDNQCFISGSIDGKVRVWGLSKGRVLDWVDAGDAVTALCYQPDGHGFVVGSLRSTCRFYERKGDMVELVAHIQSCRNSSTNRITGIQFLPEDSKTVMVMSEDSKLRIFDKMNVVSKHQGFSKSGRQMSASFTSNGKHIISIGDDSRIYLWNHEQTRKKSVRSCEYFTTEGVSVAVPWSETKSTSRISGTTNTTHETAYGMQDPPSLSLKNCFSTQSYATWPEEMLPVSHEHGEDTHQECLPPSWGLVIVTANCNGRIRAFHNYGLPVGVS